MKELYRLLGIELASSTTYHPQTDGQTEQVNQELEQFIQCQREFCFTWVSPNQCIIGLFQLFVGRLLKCSYLYIRVEV